MIYKVYRYPEGISLNGKEYAQGDDGIELGWDNKEDLLAYIANAQNITNLTEDILEERYGAYIEKEEGNV